MIIPIYLDADFKVGDIIISLENITRVKYYTISSYHEFIIIKYDKYKKVFTIRDNESDSGIELEYNTLSKFTIKTDIKTAKKRIQNAIC